MTGRPRLPAANRMVRRNVMLDHATIFWATELGDGNLSKGLRTAVQRAYLNAQKNPAREEAGKGGVSG